MEKQPASARSFVSPLEKVGVVCDPIWARGSIPCTVSSHFEINSMSGPISGRETRGGVRDTDKSRRQDGDEGGRGGAE